MDPETRTPPAADAGQNSDGASLPAGTAAPGEKLIPASQVEDIVKDRLNRQKAALEAAAEQARKQADAARAAEQGNYQQERDLALAQVASLQPQAERVPVLEAVITQQVEAIRKTIPADLLALEPAGLPIEATLAWLLKAQVSATTRPVVPGTPRNPDPVRAPQDGDAANKDAVIRATGAYRM